MMRNITVERQFNSHTTVYIMWQSVWTSFAAPHNRNTEFNAANPEYEPKCNGEIRWEGKNLEWKTYRNLQSYCVSVTGIISLIVMRRVILNDFLTFYKNFPFSGHNSGAWPLLPNMAAGVRLHVNIWGVCLGKSGSETGSSPGTSVSPNSSIHSLIFS
jgi:hypothetical protein